METQTIGTVLLPRVTRLCLGGSLNGQFVTLPSNQTVFHRDHSDSHFDRQIEEYRARMWSSQTGSFTLWVAASLEQAGLNRVIEALGEVCKTVPGAADAINAEMLESLKCHTA